MVRARPVARPKSRNPACNQIVGRSSGNSWRFGRATGPLARRRPNGLGSARRLAITTVIASRRTSDQPIRADLSSNTSIGFSGLIGHRLASACSARISHQTPRSSPHRGRHQACHPGLEPGSRSAPDREPGEAGRERRLWLWTPAQGRGDSGAGERVRKSSDPTGTRQVPVPEPFSRTECPHAFARRGKSGLALPMAS